MNSLQCMSYTCTCCWVWWAYNGHWSPSVRSSTAQGHTLVSELEEVHFGRWSETTPLIPPHTSSIPKSQVEATSPLAPPTPFHPSLPIFLSQYTQYFKKVFSLAFTHADGHHLPPNIPIWSKMPHNSPTCLWMSANMPCKECHIRYSQRSSMLVCWSAHILQRQSDKEDNFGSPTKSAWWWSR